MKRLMFACLLIAGCKQGLGDRCQVQADCESGLQCNAATGTCQGGQGSPIDANVPDGPRTDAARDASSTNDAPRDAAIDATVGG